jgi:hypothetical protein
MVEEPEVGLTVMCNFYQQWHALNSCQILISLYSHKLLLKILISP